MMLHRENTKKILVFLLLGILGGIIMQMSHTGSISLAENLRISLLGYIIFCLSLSVSASFFSK